MNDDNQSQGNHEPTCVAVSEPWALAYWARRLETPAEDVQAAVAAVGDEPAKVAAQLGKPWPFEGSGIV